MSGKILYHSTPAGYLLLQKATEAEFINEYRRGFGHYYGVDRLPDLFTYDSTGGHLSLASPSRHNLLNMIVEKWCASRFGNTAFIPRYSEALRLFETIGEIGIKLELVYCQLAWRDGDETRLKDYEVPNEESPIISITYGYDVSWVNCKHSAILQPGIVSSNFFWRKKLNQYGLLNHYEEAIELRQEYLKVYPYPPFDIYLVHSIHTK